jgi:uncharacterized membrane protein YkoI
MKKLFSLMLALVMVLSMGGTAFAQTNSAAEALAKQQVPATAVLTSTGEDDTHYEFIYDDKVSRVKYAIDIIKNPMAVRKVTSETYGRKGGEQVTLTEAQAGAVVTELYGATNIQNVYVAKDDGKYHYLVLFSMGDDNTLYRAKVNAENGNLMGLNIRMGAPEAAQTKLTAAVQAALAQVPGASVVDVELEQKDGVLYYEIELLNGNRRHEVHVDANTGAVLEAEAPTAARVVKAADYKPGDDRYMDNDDGDDDWFDDDDDFDDDRYDDDDDDRYDDDNDDNDDDDNDDDDDDDNDNDDDDDDRYENDDDDDDDDD